ncbi:MAG: lysylphosphatidylglycerol synthase domain-containing protein [Candidatus Marinimicrobia bacterium]|nr:lysylphosphatidylglycerol synthase domain-containing protein [Candidatus Neomarinimicrobiota bacterium]
MKKILSTLLKIGVSADLFWWLSRYVNVKELLAFYHSLSLPLILAVLGLGILNIAGQAARFFYTASKLMPPFTFRQALISHFSGFTFRLALPASIGEVGKTFLLPGTINSVYILF